MKRIGLTGGIGSGKSTLAGMLERLGAPVLDLDALGRELHNEAGCRDALTAAFGDGILDAGGRVDRVELGRLCFADADRMAELNRIMHPRIWQREVAWLDRQSAPYALIEASVLIESGGASRMDAVVVVLADDGVRRQRVMRRPGMNGARFDAIVRHQCSDAERRAAADYIIDNNADLGVLEVSAVGLHRSLLKRFA